jgi:hypothetical protein
MIETSLPSLSAFSRHSLGKCVILGGDIAFRKPSRILESCVVETLNSHSQNKLKNSENRRLECDAVQSNL